MVLEGGLRLSQLSALSLLEMSSSESLGVENGELLSTSSYLRLRLRDEPASMETRCLREQRDIRRVLCNNKDVRKIFRIHTFKKREKVCVALLTK